MSSTSAKPSICLCMIVKDEVEVIERCLDSVRGLIDCWVICDTGSDDGTQELVRALLDGIPGELHERPWVDFGHNRSELMALARGKADYLLLIDADWTITAEPGALEHLTADAYMVRVEYQDTGALAYNNHLLVRDDRDWWFVGATHEFIQTKGPATELRLQGVLVTNWASGADRRALRWRWDAQVLEEALGRDPDDARTVFYLAQTYSDLGETARAIELYERRAALGGWPEEVFFAMYQIGALRASLRDWAGAVPALLDAWNYRPSRIEPLYWLARGYREGHAYHPAHLFASRALDRPEPEDTQFIQPWIYRWGALFEYSMCAYWVGDAGAALHACDRLLAMPDLPETVRRDTAMNQFFLRARSRDQVDRPGTGTVGGPRRRVGPMPTRPLAVIVPTRDRPKNVERLVELDAPEVDWFFCVDRNDRIAEYERATGADRGQAAFDYWGNDDGNVWMAVGGPQRLVPWINQVSAELVTEYRYIGFIGDDHFPRTPDWDRRICEALARLGTGVVYANDLLMSERLPTAAFMTSDIIQTLGYMAPPSLQHMFVDNFWLDIGHAIKRIKYLPEVVIEHLHPLAGTAQPDASYETTMPMMQTDGIAYDKYKAEQFHDDVAKLAALLNGPQ